MAENGSEDKFVYGEDKRDLENILETRRKRRSSAGKTKYNTDKVIDNLTPDEDLVIGKRFLRRLMDKRGPRGVFDFAKKAAKALSEKGSLDYTYDFDDAEKAAFNEARLNWLSRRSFFGVGCVGAAGGYYLLDGSLEGLAKFVESFGNDPEQPNIFRQTHDQVTGYHWLSNIVIGGALVNEAVDKAVEIKLEHIADAVTEMHEKMRQEGKFKESKKSPGSPQR